MKTRSRVRIIGVPLDLGQSERGTDVGPAALRYAGLKAGVESLGYDVYDEGNVTVPIQSVVPKEKNVEVIARVCEDLARVTAACVAQGDIPLTLGGDHSVAIGSLSGVLRCKRTGVLWIDAHGDFNTPETSPSGNVHGMPLAVLLRRGAPQLVQIRENGHDLLPEDVALIGIRQLDRRERDELRAVGIHVFSMRDVDEKGMARVIAEALDRVSAHGALHVSLDVDALDPSVVPGVATPVAGGLSYREAHLLLETVADSGLLTSMDVVEVNPMLDHKNATAKVAVDLVLSALGSRIF